MKFCRNKYIKMTAHHECHEYNFEWPIIFLPYSSGDTPYDASNWNLDLQELEYNMSRKDMNDAKIHHLLAEELYKPARRVSGHVTQLKNC